MKRSLHEAWHISRLTTGTPHHTNSTFNLLAAVLQFPPHYKVENIICTTALQNPEEATQDYEDGGNEPDIIMEDQPDVILEDQPSTSAGQKERKTPFSRYAKPLGASTPNDDIQIIAEKKPSDKGWCWLLLS